VGGRGGGTDNVQQLPIGNKILSGCQMDKYSIKLVYLYIDFVYRLPTNPKLFPSVGNGHLATTVYRDAVFVNGIYSGETGAILITFKYNVNCVQHFPESNVFIFFISVRIFLRYY